MAFRPASAFLSSLWLIMHNNVEILKPILGTGENNKAKMCGRRSGVCVCVMIFLGLRRSLRMFIMLLGK